MATLFRSIVFGLCNRLGLVNRGRNCADGVHGELHNGQRFWDAEPAWAPVDGHKSIADCAQVLWPTRPKSQVVSDNKKRLLSLNTRQLLSTRGHRIAITKETVKDKAGYSYKQLVTALGREFK